MKYLLAIAALLALPQLATADQVGLFSEPTAYSCTVLDVPGPSTLYVVHRFSRGTNGSRFRIEPSTGFTGTLLSVSSEYTIVSGDPLNGITMSYDPCMSGSIVVLSLTFMLDGTASPCSWLRTAAHPLSPDGEIDVFNCPSGRSPGDWGGVHVIQGYGFCYDLSADPDFPCKPADPPVPVAPSTWGAVKSLYR
jgi:hypothetical protein